MIYRIFARPYSSKIPPPQLFPIPESTQIQHITAIDDSFQMPECGESTGQLKNLTLMHWKITKIQQFELGSRPQIIEWQSSDSIEAIEAFFIGVIGCCYLSFVFLNFNCFVTKLSLTNSMLAQPIRGAPLSFA